MIPARHLKDLQDILEVIKHVYPGSYPVVGGGALRDAYLGKPVKDVDVFLRWSDHKTLDSPFTSKVPTSRWVEEYGRPDMHGAWDWNAPMYGFPVQLILAEFTDLVDLASTFDLGLSRFTFDGERAFAHPDFHHDALNKILTIRRGDNDYEIARSRRRIKRLTSTKYTDFKEAA